jgi:hypothetical protein
VAVALITALATISGGATAGIIGLVAQNRQSKVQQAEQRRQTCRAAYVELLAKYEDAANVLSDIWQEPPPQNESVKVFARLYEPVDRVRELNVAVGIVYLEGPESVTRAAEAIMQCHVGEMDMIHKVAHENTGRPEKLIDLSEPSLDSLDDARSKVRIEFIRAAANALK